MNIKYRSDIDGLRAIAVLSVIAYHLNSHWLQGGFIGVDVFFVISGYLITKIIYTDIVNNQFSFKVFYQRRINRILPTFFIVMLATSFGAWYVLLPDEFMLYLKSLKSTTYFWGNMFFAKNTGGYWDIAAETMPILHTWSLAVEEQFYILLPFLLLFAYGIQFKTKRKLLTFNKTSLLIVLAVIAFASFYLSQISFRSSFLTKYNYYSLFTARAGELLIGSIIGIISVTSSKSKELNKRRLWINNIVSLIGFLAMILSIIFISKNSLFPSFIALIPTIGAALIIYFYDSRTYIARFLSLKPVVFIGKISFSMYLWHWPLIVLTKQYLFIDNFDTVWQYLFVISLTFILSVFTYLLVETPCRKYKKSFKFSFINYYLVPVILIFTFIFYTSSQNINFSSNYDKRKLLFTVQTKFLRENSGVCYDKIKGDCVLGYMARKPKIMLIGDSNAAHFAPYLQEAGEMYGFSFYHFSSGDCWMIDNYIIGRKDVEEICNKWMNDIIKPHIKNSKIIIFGARREWYLNNKYEHLIYKELPEYIQKLKKQGKIVILLGQIPYADISKFKKLQKQYLRNDNLMDGSSALTNNYINVNEILKKISKDNDAIYLYPLDDLNEDSKTNWPVYKGMIAYSDYRHMGEYVTRQWSQEVLPKQKEFWENIAQIANEK